MCRSKLNIVLLSLALLGSANQISANEEPEVQSWEEFKEEVSEKASKFKARVRKFLTKEADAEDSDEEDRDAVVKILREDAEFRSQTIDALNQTIESQEGQIRALREAIGFNDNAIRDSEDLNEIHKKRIAVLENSQNGHSTAQAATAAGVTGVVCGALGILVGRASK